jgi:hypothetical protein
MLLVFQIVYVYVYEYVYEYVYVYRLRCVGVRIQAAGPSGAHARWTPRTASVHRSDSLPAVAWSVLFGALAGSVTS